MAKATDQTKLAEMVIKQNLLLWQLTKSFLDIEKQLKKSLDRSL